MRISQHLRPIKNSVPCFVYYFLDTCKKLYSHTISLLGGSTQLYSLWLIPMVIVSPQFLGLWDPFQMASMAKKMGVIRTTYLLNGLILQVVFQTPPSTLFASGAQGIGNHCLNCDTTIRPEIFWKQLIRPFWRNESLNLTCCLFNSHQPTIIP